MAFTDKFAIASTILATAVVDTGTFTVGYPTGTSQLSFNAGLAGSGHYAVLNNNDKYSWATIHVSFGASDITITNDSGETWAAWTTVDIYLAQVPKRNVMYIGFYIPLAAITAAGDVVTEFRPGVAGVIEAVQFAVSMPVTTAAKAADLNLEIDTTNVTGGVVALTSVAATPLGKVIAGSAITGANVLTRESKLSVEAANVTAFAEGNGMLHVRIRLDDD